MKLTDLFSRKNLFQLYKNFFFLSSALYANEIFYNMNHTIVEGVITYVDEEGSPISDMDVLLRFTPTPLQEVQMEVKSFERMVKTDSDGRVSFREHALQVGIHPVHEDFWSVRAGIGQFHNHLRQSDDTTSIDYWRMRLEETVVLPRKINPRPMLANEYRGRMPQLNETYAFDLEVNDWVRPHGRGQHPDMIFTLTGQATWRERPPESLRRNRIVEYDVTLRIHFPNEKDGILPVEEPEFAKTNLHLGRVAPEEGYLRELLIRRGDQHPGDDVQLEGYWIRTRSRVDEITGELLGARHGKIIGNIRYSYNLLRGEFVGSMVFQYISSPDENRSMEFNGENLARDPQWTPRK